MVNCRDNCAEIWDRGYETNVNGIPLTVSFGAVAIFLNCDFQSSTPSVVMIHFQPKFLKMFPVIESFFLEFS